MNKIINKFILIFSIGFYGCSTKIQTFNEELNLKDNGFVVFKLGKILMENNQFDYFPLTFSN
jgi:hypothetical protein